MTLVSVLQHNQHGHVIFTVTGLDLTGAQEIKRLEAHKYSVSGYAKSLLLNKDNDGYDARHRLGGEKSYTIAIMPGTIIPRESERTTANLRKRGLEFGYKKPLAGMMPRIREAVSDDHMKEMGFWYIACLHDSIMDSGREPSVLVSDRDGGGRWLGSLWAHADNQWNDRGGFAFLVSADD